MLDIVWNKLTQEPILSFKILDSKSRVVLSKDFRIGSVDYPWLVPTSYVEEEKKTKSQVNGSHEWECVPPEGRVSLNQLKFRIRCLAAVMLFVLFTLLGITILVCRLSVWCFSMSMRGKSKLIPVIPAVIIDRGPTLLVEKKSKKRM